MKLGANQLSQLYQYHQLLEMQTYKIITKLSLKETRLKQATYKYKQSRRHEHDNLNLWPKHRYWKSKRIEAELLDLKHNIMFVIFILTDTIEI